MGLLLQLNHLVEVLNVNVGIHTEQALQYSFGNAQKVLGKRYADRWRKNGLVVDLRLNPVHKVINVAWRRALYRLLDYLTISPVITTITVGINRYVWLRLVMFLVTCIWHRLTWWDMFDPCRILWLCRITCWSDWKSRRLFWRKNFKKNY